MASARKDIKQQIEKRLAAEADGYSTEALTDLEIEHARLLMMSGATWKHLSQIFKRREEWLRYTYTDLLTAECKRIDQKVLHALLQNALDGNVTAQIFWVKVRCQWRDNTQIEITGKDGGAIEIKTDTPPQETFEQWLARQPAIEVAANGMEKKLIDAQ